MAYETAFWSPFPFLCPWPNLSSNQCFTLGLGWKKSWIQWPSISFSSPLYFFPSFLLSFHFSSLSHTHTHIRLHPTPHLFPIHTAFSLLTLQPSFRASFSWSRSTLPCAPSLHWTSGSRRLPHPYNHFVPAPPIYWISSWLSLQRAEEDVQARSLIGAHLARDWSLILSQRIFTDHLKRQEKQG